MVVKETNQKEGRIRGTRWESLEGAEEENK
jgi:hypothetical protein